MTAATSVCLLSPCGMDGLRKEALALALVRAIAIEEDPLHGDADGYERRQ